MWFNSRFTDKITQGKRREIRTISIHFNMDYLLVWRRQPIYLNFLGRDTYFYEDEPSNNH